nr:MAG TPA: hypothetical protein [Caudoviricetes sp.]
MLLRYFHIHHKHMAEPHYTGFVCDCYSRARRAAYEPFAAVCLVNFIKRYSAV